MKKNEFSDPEDVQTILDLSTIIMAGALGGLSAIVVGSPEVGALATGIIAVTGISLTRITPARRKLDAASRTLVSRGQEDAWSRSKVSK